MLWIDTSSAAPLAAPDEEKNSPKGKSRLRSRRGSRLRKGGSGRWPGLPRSCKTCVYRHPAGSRSYQEIEKDNTGFALTTSGASVLNGGTEMLSM